MSLQPPVLILVLLALPVSSAFGAPAVILPKTGQTLCYSDVGTEVSCAGTGQDGASRIGAAWPAPRFVDSNGTITDTLTDLVWMKNADCFGVVGWQQALEGARTLAAGRCGLADGSSAGQWRLPNRRELLSLANFQQGDGAAWLTGAGFVNATNHFYWTSDSDVRSPGVKWVYHPAGAAWLDTHPEITVRDFHAMYVRDAADLVPVTASVAGGGGSLSSPAAVTVRRGGAATFTLIAANGFEPVVADGSTCPAGTFSGATYTTGPVTGSCAVDFSFRPATFTIAAETSPAGGGSVVCSPGTTIPAATAVSCTITPSEGFTISAVTVDGIAQNVANVSMHTHNFGTVAGNHRISATFSGELLLEAMKAYRSIYASVPLTPEEQMRLDVAPIGSDGKPKPDGKVDVGDVVMWLRMIAGLLDW